ncbi:MAG: GIY-YIG nuclease family protein [Xenococcaceae cyanobacterium MO_207.B15]|nr:GIY-YIG nuclease family protein [Xenococcaceae cyanobacterium MO_207.B15]
MSDFGFIYFIYDFSSKQTKIGKTSKHPAYRLKELQTGNTTKLELIHFYETSEMSDEETKLHHQYNQYRTLGEWFELPLPLLLEITHQGSQTTQSSNSSNILKSDLQESLSIISQKFAYLPKEVQNLIQKNAPHTVSVQEKGNQNKGIRYKCYDSNGRCIGRIKGKANARYC